MAEDERHAEPEATEMSSDSAERQVSLYPITVRESLLSSRAHSVKRKLLSLCSVSGVLCYLRRTVINEFSRALS